MIFGAETFKASRIAEFDSFQGHIRELTKGRGNATAVSEKNANESLSLFVAVMCGSWSFQSASSAVLQSWFKNITFSSIFE